MQKCYYNVHGFIVCRPSIIENFADCEKEWSEWTPCDQECGGTRYRMEKIIIPATDGGACSKVKLEERQCDDKCPSDCEFTWALSPCSKECGGGTQTRYAKVIREPTNGGKACPTRIDTLACNTQPCPIDCKIDTLDQWSSCSKPCGGGFQVQKQVVVQEALYGGKDCPDAPPLVRECNTQACPIDCEEKLYDDWSDCSVPCGGGWQTQEYEIFRQPQYGGKPCVLKPQKRQCNTHSCDANVPQTM